MKIHPFLIRYKETWLLGPVASCTMQEFRIGLGLIFGEVGISLFLDELKGYGCCGCSNVAWAKGDQIPLGWDKVFRPDSSYYYRCPECIEKGFRDEAHVG